MTKKTTKRALVSSLVILALCFTMLLGTTFAWFTDSAASNGNIIKTGSLDVEMSWAEGTADPATATYADASTGAIFNYDLWEPGYAVARHIKIENKGTLALKYKVQIIANGEVSKLADVIDVYYADPAVKVESRDALTDSMKIGTLTDVLAGMETTAAGNLLAGASHNITLVLKMNENAGNEYKNLSIGTDFSVQIQATQLAHEEDSFGPDYDEGAEAVIVNTADDFVAALANGGDVALGANISVSDIVTISKDTVIYGNGNTLTSNAGRAINVDGTEPVKVTIKDLNIVGNGERAVNVINNAHEVTLENVNATADNYAVMVATSAAGAKVTVNNSNLSGLNVVNVAAPNAVVNVNNCDLVCNDNNSVESYGAISTYTTAANTVVTANGCTFTVAGDSKAAINSCDGATITIDGSSDVPTAVAYITYANNYGYSFFSMEKAVEKATNADVIVLLADVTVDALAKTVKVNTNGYTLTVAGTPYTGTVTVG